MRCRDPPPPPCLAAGTVLIFGQDGAHKDQTAFLCVHFPIIVAANVRNTLKLARTIAASNHEPCHHTDDGTQL
jgi:hypothetical protein